jgi:hypothetical protein
MANKYLYMDKHFRLCCIQKDTQTGKYYISLGGRKDICAGGKVFYKTVEDAQVVLDTLAKDMGWKNV